MEQEPRAKPFRRSAPSIASSQGPMSTWSWTSAPETPALSEKARSHSSESSSTSGDNEASCGADPSPNCTTETWCAVDDLAVTARRYIAGLDGIISQMVAHLEVSSGKGRSCLSFETLGCGFESKCSLALPWTILFLWCFLCLMCSIHLVISLFLRRQRAPARIWKATWSSQLV